MNRKKLFFAIGSLVLIGFLIVGGSVPYQTIVMRCSYDRGKTYSIVVRLENYLFGGSKFHRRVAGKWELGSFASPNSVKIERKVTRDSFFQTTYYPTYAYGENAKQLGLEEGADIISALPIVIDFVAEERIIKRDYFLTTDFKTSTQQGIELRQSCQTD